MPPDRRNAGPKRVSTEGPLATADPLREAPTAAPVGPLAIASQTAEGLKDTLQPSTSSGGDLGTLVTIPREYYELGAEIARGGMGRIVHARDRRLGRDIAIKELLSPSPVLERRFEREMKLPLAFSTRRSSVCTTLDVGPPASSSTR